MIDNIELASLRQNYSQRELLTANVAADPFEQFAAWFEEAREAEILEPNAMHLGTSSLGGVPSGRIVLLKGFDSRAFTFFTNYNSIKARELISNPSCYLHFFWKELERQVYIRGAAVMCDARTSDEYFASRPLESRIGAWASDQSSVIASRDVLEKRFAELSAKYADGNVPRPPHWGGFDVTPTLFEFWQGRPNRLHDRLRYRHDGVGWKIERLSP